LAVADAADGDWPQRARVAAVALVGESKDNTPSLGVRLLADLRDVFGNHDALATESVLNELHQIDESPWADLHGKPLDSRGLSNRLRPYGVRPVNVASGDKRPKGYRREHLYDAWVRYLPTSPHKSATAATSATTEAASGFDGSGLGAGVPLPAPLSATRKPSNNTKVADVADVADLREANPEPWSSKPAPAVCPRMDAGAVIEGEL